MLACQWRQSIKEVSCQSALTPITIHRLFSFRPFLTFYFCVELSSIPILHFDHKQKVLKRGIEDRIIAENAKRHFQMLAWFLCSWWNRCMAWSLVEVSNARLPIALEFWVLLALREDSDSKGTFRVLSPGVLCAIFIGNSNNYTTA